MLLLPPQGYLEMLHANHEDWLSTGTSLAELRQRIEPLMSGARRERRRGGGRGGRPARAGEGAFARGRSWVLPTQSRLLEIST